MSVVLLKPAFCCGVVCGVEEALAEHFFGTASSSPDNPFGWLEKVPAGDHCMGGT